MRPWRDRREALGGRAPIAARSLPRSVTEAGFKRDRVAAVQLFQGHAQGLVSETELPAQRDTGDGRRIRAQGAANTAAEEAGERVVLQPRHGLALPVRGGAEVERH